ncbi:hypothetical protein MTO96_014099 [Rhipicephalus appendiculatus]
MHGGVGKPSAKTWKPSIYRKTRSLQQQFLFVLIVLSSQLGNVSSEYRHVELQMKHKSLLLNYRQPVREENFACPQHCAALSSIMTKKSSFRTVFSSFPLL